MIKESKYCTDILKKYFKNSTKCWIFDNFYIDCDVKVRDHRHIIGKYGASAHRDIAISTLNQIKLNHKIPVVFHNLKNMIPILLCKN